MSKRYKLKLNQSQLDFVDVDIVKDVPFFLDPRALRLSDTQWAHECVSLLKDFFRALLSAVQTGDEDAGLELLNGLHEPNETHLGLSKGKSDGNAIGEELAQQLWEALSKNTVVKQTGLLEDLDDAALLVEGIGNDRISDIATNVIREPLIHYTQAMCDYYGIPKVPDVDPGPIWSPSAQAWTQDRVDLPVVPSGKLLLVPKAMVRRRLAFDYKSYYSHEVMAYLKGVEIDAGTSLVRLLKTKQTKEVYKKDLQEKYGKGKKVATHWTDINPSMLDQFRKRIAEDPPGALPHDVLANGKSDALPDWDGALDAVRNAPVGAGGATEFHHAVEALLTMLLHGSLAYPVREQHIHDGRKRVDISYSNVAASGFFAWLSRNHPAAHVVIECKNYAGDPANPELDQLSGRFSPSRGKVGFLACRSFTDKDLFWQRCRDTADDVRGWIIPLDDDDLAELVELVRDGGPESPIWNFFKSRFDRLTH